MSSSSDDSDSNSDSDSDENNAVLVKPAGIPTNILEQDPPQQVQNGAIKKSSYFEREASPIPAKIDQGTSVSYNQDYRSLVEEFQNSLTIHKGFTLLHFAAGKGHYILCKRILDNQMLTDPAEESDIYGNTPLHTAARYGHLEVFKLLVYHVHDKFRKNTGKVTPFQMAASYGNWPICQFIIDNFGDLNAVTDGGNTLLQKLQQARRTGNLVLYQSIIDGFEEKKLKEELFQETKNDWDKHYNWEKKQKDWDCTGNSTLYQNPNNWNNHPNIRADWERKFSTGDFGETPFYLAAKNSRLTLSEVMIEYENFPVEHPEGKFGNTLLHMAAKVGNIPLYQMIIDNIEDKNPKNDRGETPFHEAAKNGHLEMCQILKDTYNVQGKELKIEALAALIDKVAENGHFELIQWIYDNNMTEE